MGQDVGTLVFEEQPTFANGVLQWSVRNFGQLAIPEGQPAGEYEVWDAEDLTSTILPRQTAPLPESVYPDQSVTIKVPIQISPPPSSSRHFKIVVELGTHIADIDFDWLEDMPASPTMGSLVFEQRPYLTQGCLAWSVRNTGELAVPAGLPIGEYEIWDYDNVTSTIVPKRDASSGAELYPGDVGWTDPLIDLAPLTPVQGDYKAVVQLGLDVAEVDYRVTPDGQVIDRP